jgi:uncharacterized membrane protein YdjX (TVP38/TMEM64 family)
MSKTIALLSLLIAIIVLSVVLPSLPRFDLIAHSMQIKAWLSSAGYAAPLVFALITAGLTALGFPRLFFCTLAGMIFGFFWGLLLSHAATLCGAYFSFLLARRGGHDWVKRRFPQFATISNAVPVEGWKGVLLMRQLPINGLTNDILLGIGKTGHADFWIGSSIGFLPLGIAATLAGAGLYQFDMPRMAHYLGIAACAFLALSFSLKVIAAQKSKYPLC